MELTVVTDSSYSDSAVSRLMTNIVAAANEFQQDLTHERMADMRAAMKRHGKRVGRVPFGYQADPPSSVNIRSQLGSSKRAIVAKKCSGNFFRAWQ